MPPKTKTPKPAETDAPTETTTTPLPSDVPPMVTADPTPAERADLMRAAAANGLEMLKGHTDNSPYHLATKNAPEWSPTMAEYIGAQVEGTRLYTGPSRPEGEEPGKWDPTNVLPKVSAADMRKVYGTLSRVDAAVRHSAGCVTMGVELTDPGMTFQPDRTALYEISVSESPMATARRLAAKAAAPKASASADGLTRNQRSELDTLMRAVLKKAEKAAPGVTQWHALLEAAAEEYGANAAAAILASVERITKGRPDSGKWVAAFGAALRKEEPEEPTAEPTAEPADK